MIRPKLLLADDSVTIRKVVELTFADEGVDVSSVADSQSAMLKFVEIQPDIVLVDVNLSEINGYRICEMIKQDAATRHVPVLLLVGSFEPFDQDEAERCGADGFLTKPFHSIRDLVARVWGLLGKPPGGDTSIAEADAPKLSPETADIDNLYQRSFEDTAEIQDFDTVEDLLGDHGMDDDMIEASFPTEAFHADFSQFKTSPEVPKPVTEFDWSPSSIVTSGEMRSSDQFEASKPAELSDEYESDAVESYSADTSRTKEFELSQPVVPYEPQYSPDPILAPGVVNTLDRQEEAWTAGSAPASSEPASPPSSSHTDLPVDDFIYFDPYAEEEPEKTEQSATSDSHDEIPVLDLHIPARNRDSEAPGIAADSDEQFSLDVDDEPPAQPEQDPVEVEQDATADQLPEEAEIVPPEELRADISSQTVDEEQGRTFPPEVEQTKMPAEIPSDMIDAIVKRVLDQLSDRVVREVALETVPQVAEKLIREALDAGNKK